MTSLVTSISERYTSFNFLLLKGGTIIFSLNLIEATPFREISSGIISGLGITSYFSFNSFFSILFSCLSKFDTSFLDANTYQSGFHAFIVVSSFLFSSSIFSSFIFSSKYEVLILSFTKSVLVITNIIFFIPSHFML